MAAALARFELRVHPSGAVTRHDIETGWAIHPAQARGRRPANDNHVGQASSSTAWPSVITNWRKFNQPFEGVLPFMYTDAIGLVTTGMGNLVDPVGAALALPWRNPDGSLADAGTVQAQWQAVKYGPVNSSTGAGYLTSIRLDDAGIQQAINASLSSDIDYMQRYFPNWASLPADAQLAILSMDWAMGPGFPATFKQFTAAINEGRYADAANLSDFQGVGVAARIAANKFALNNAQIVADQGLDASTLYWPSIASGMATWKKVAAVAAGMVAAAGGTIAAIHYGDDIEHAMGRLGRIF